MTKPDAGAVDACVDVDDEVDGVLLDCVDADDEIGCVLLDCVDVVAIVTAGVDAAAPLTAVEPEAAVCMLAVELCAATPEDDSDCASLALLAAAVPAVSPPLPPQAVNKIAADAQPAAIPRNLRKNTFDKMSPSKCMN